MRWAVFFGGDNELQWSALSDRKSPRRKALQPFIDLVEQRAPIAALPRIRKLPDRIDWYVGWRSSSDARFAGDLLSAFLGRTYAEMSEPLRPLEATDAVEEAFAEEFDRGAVRIQVHPKFRKEARERLNVLATCLLERPHRRASKVRPVGRILRDLEFAMQVGADELAAEEIRALRGGGHLDEVNLAFLDLRRLAANSDWAGVLTHEALPSVLSLRSLPWRIRKLLLEAVYHRHLAALVAEGAVDEACALFEALLPDFAVALSSRRNLAGLEVDVCLVLADEVRKQGDLTMAEGAFLRIADEGCGAFADGLRAKFARRKADKDDAGAIPPFASALDLAQGALGDGDLDQAYTLALGAPPSQRRVNVLLQCARLLDQEAASTQVLSAWDDLPLTDREALLTHVWFRTHLDHLRAAVGGLVATAPPTSSWLGWFERLRSKVTWPGAVSRAEQGAVEWNVETVAGDPEAISAVVSIVEGTLDDWAAEALRQALPYILEAFPHDPPDQRVAPLYCSLFDLLATDEALTLSSMSALTRLAQARLSTTQTGYADTVGIVVSAVEQADTPASVRLIADVLEMLIVTPCASQGERRAAATRLGSVAVRWWTRVDEVDRALVRELCTELHVNDLLAVDSTSLHSEGAESEWGALTGLKIAFYSLSESALKRAVTVLQTACPDANLKAFCEQGGTDSMRDAAKTADLFVVATKAATHAATISIEQSRRAGKPIVYALGKGSTSLLDAVRRWLRAQRAN